jgi:hypothetical protein
MRSWIGNPLVALTAVFGLGFALCLGWLFLRKRLSRRRQLLARHRERRAFWGYE